MHGFEVLAWLTTHPPHNGVPVVVLTGSGEVVLAQLAHALGAHSFLTKPLNPTELKHMLDTIGNVENWRGQPRAPGAPVPKLRFQGPGPA
jgi:CheY-like chemotaxis protein